MKQTVFMVLVTALGTIGPLFGGPFIALAVYYLFAVLRPQYLWQWALPPDVSWSQYVALAALLSVLGSFLGLCPLAGGHRGLARPRLTVTHRALAIFWVWVGVSYVGAQHRDVAWPWLLEYSKIFLMLAVSTLVVRTPKQIWILYLLTTLSLIYIAWEVNALYLFQGYLGIYRNGYGGLDNNGAGLMLAMGIPLSLYAWEAIRQPYRWLFAAAVPVLLHAVLMTYSRGAMVSLIACAPLMLLRTQRPVQATLVAAGLALLIPVLAGQEIRARFLTLQQYEADASANSRFQSWQAAWRISLDYPVIGVGVRNSNLYSHAYGADFEGRTIHSQYLQILADSGYPALVAYVIALVGLARLFQRVRRDLVKPAASFEGSLKRAILSGIEGALGVFCVGSLFLSLEVFELPYLLMFLGAQLSALHYSESEVRQAVPARSRAPATNTVLIAVGRVQGGATRASGT